MTTVLLYLMLLGNSIASLVEPWIGVICAYLVAILSPHDIWWWLFEDIRPFYWVIVPTLAGFCVALVRGKLDFSALNTKINRWLALLWVCFTISYLFGPYVHVKSEYTFYDPDFMFSTLTKTFFTYFISVVLIDNAKKLRALTLVLAVTTLYLTYWANAQYLIYHKFGRLHGPTNLAGHGIYADENNFAVLFVVGFPFVFHLSQYIRNKMLRWALLATIPFAWHAVFLTASRGALIGIAVVLLTFVLRSQKKLAGLLLIVAFVAAFTWQAGDVMRSRSSTITSYNEEESASTRLEAWDAAIGMMAAHPVTGVGFASFGQAFPDFSNKVPRVAHNTFFQIGGEWGVLAAITYLVLIFTTLNSLRANARALRDHGGDPNRKLYYHVSEACLLSLTGFFTCSMFLSLQGYEVLYYLFLISNAALVGSRALLNQGNRAALPQPGTPARAARVLRPPTVRRG